ncbi:hypothetical protein, partial [Terrabacter sp. Ter38]
MSYTSEGVSAIVAGFESPLAAKRSVVLLASSKPDGLDAAVAALRGGEGYDKSVQGSLSVIRGKQIDALVGDQTYTLGQLPLLKRIDWWVSSQWPGYTLLRLVVMALVWLVG